MCTRNFFIRWHLSRHLYNALADTLCAIQLPFLRNTPLQCKAGFSSEVFPHARSIPWLQHAITHGSTQRRKRKIMKKWKMWLVMWEQSQEVPGGGEGEGGDDDGERWVWIESACSLQLLLRANMKYFAPQVCLADAREDANRIFIIVSGQVEIFLPVKDGGGLLRTLKRG